MKKKKTRKKSNPRPSAPESLRASLTPSAVIGILMGLGLIGFGTHMVLNAQEEFFALVTIFSGVLLIGLVGVIQYTRQ